jgi:SagB-type dehydrogenase family enzyme
MNRLIDPTPQLTRKSKFALAEAMDFHRGASLDPLTVSRSMHSVMLHLTQSDLKKVDADNVKGFATAPRIQLEQCSPGASPLRSLLDARRSISAGGPIDVSALSRLMFLAARVSRVEKTELADKSLMDVRFRTYPSAGGLFPCESYVMPIAVRGLPTGVYHYNPIEHSVATLDPEAGLDRFKRAFFVPDSLDEAAAIVVLTAVLDRSVRKYGARGYRFALLEAGHLSQNLCLAATELGLNCCPWGGYYDEEVLELVRPRESEVVAAVLLVSGKRQDT